MGIIINMFKFATALLVGFVAATEMKQSEFAFMKYIAKHNKNYGTREEYTARLASYLKMDKFINEVNAPNSEHTHTAAHNQFSDWTTAEFEKLMTEKPMEAQNSEDHPIEAENFTAGTTVDWRTSGGSGGGCVNPVTNQGSCGSCFSFAGTAAAESSHCIAGNGLLKLSEQQGVDCSNSYGNNGCSGGLAFYIWNYMHSNGLELGAAYPYKAVEGTCKYQKSLGKVGTNSPSYTQVKGGSSGSWASSANMMAAVSVKPNAVSVHASSPAFQSYSSGVVTGTACGTATNHAIVIVGYSTATSPNYYIVRNSWGASWGQGGYINIGMATGAGVCGINQRVGWPSTKTWSA